MKVYRDQAFLVIEVTQEMFDSIHQGYVSSCTSTQKILLNTKRDRMYVASLFGLPRDSVDAPMCQYIKVIVEKVPLSSVISSTCGQKLLNSEAEECRKQGLKEALLSVSRWMKNLYVQNPSIVTFDLSALSVEIDKSIDHKVSTLAPVYELMSEITRLKRELKSAQESISAFEESMLAQRQRTGLLEQEMKSGDVGGKIVCDFTHQKRSYKAKVLAWDGTNTDLVIAKVLTISGVVSVTPTENLGVMYLMVRYTNGDVNTLHIGAHIVRRQNGTVKIYRNKEDFGIQYEPIN